MDFGGVYFIDVNVAHEILIKNIWYIFKILLVGYFVFYWIPSKVFPQEHTGVGIQKVIYNLVYMVAFVETVVPFLIFIHIFSLFLFVIILLLVKIAFMKWYYKVNISHSANALKTNSMLFFLDAFDKPRELRDTIITNIQNRLITFQKSITFYGFFKYSLFFLVFIYIISIFMARGLMSYADPAPDTSQFIEWVDYLQKNTLFWDTKSGGSDFYGISIMIFFISVLTNVNIIPLFSVYPVLLILSLYLVIYYVVKDFSHSKYVAIFAVMIHGLVMMTPLSNIILGNIVITSSPNIVDLYGFKFYMPTPIESLDGIANGLIPYTRYIAGMAYEHSSVFVLLNAYFLIRVFKTHLNRDIILYGLTLLLVFTFHGGGAIVLIFMSVLVSINAFLFGRLNFALLKKGIPIVIIAPIIGTAWALSMIKYGIPEAVGNAAPFLDALFKTHKGASHVAKLGFDSVSIVGITTIHIILIVVLFTALIFAYLFTNRRFENSSFLLIAVGVFIIYFGSNMGVPLLPAHSRLAEYLFIALTLLGSFYFLFFIYKPLFILLKNYARGIIITVSYALFFTLALAAPKWINTKDFWRNISSTGYPSIPKTILDIYNENQPFSWTVVSYVQAYAKVKNMGYHINTQNFVLNYNPTSRYLKIPTKKVYIFSENTPHPYKGLAEWYYRWRARVNDELRNWIAIYSMNHDNIKIFKQTQTITVYEVDNENYLDYLREKDKK